MRTSIVTLLLSCCAFLHTLGQTIEVKTKAFEVVYRVGNDGRLYQSYIGRRLANPEELQQLPQGTEAYIPNGMKDYFESALQLTHNDGNPSTDLKYKTHTQRTVSPGVEETIITLADDKYPTEIRLSFTAYNDENVVRSKAEISSKEKKPVTLENYASSMLHFPTGKYYMTEFHGDWAHEVNMVENELTFGKKIVDTKLGTRANMFCTPMFILSLNNPASEQGAETILGTLAWTGNFRFVFEVDNARRLRVVSGINPHSSQYTLAKGETFSTPDFIMCYSDNGTGEASRQMHRWARKHQLKDGMGKRLSLLNNWETTYFDFNEEKLGSLMDEAAMIGVDMFLLDDGWFGNKHPRSSDNAGLGDWEETVEKLPNGIGRLTKMASDKGVKFGLWIEPEMVNPKSELYEKHKDWVIHLPNRDEYYFRNQMVLDLSNPKVQDYVYGIVDGLMTKYPEIAYFKWDCNSPITNIYSAHLKNKQSHLYIDYVRGLYNVLDRVKAKYPTLPMMLCAGGGGRSDYKALEYFTEFWPSDNTDAVERIFIQWGFSHVFPTKAMAAHVTSWGKQSLKYRVDVASMCKLGFDIRINGMSEKDIDFCKRAVANHKRLTPAILDGDMYRLVSPYETDHAALMYVDNNQQNAVVYGFSLHPRYSEPVAPVRLQGLDANKKYKVTEINLPQGQNPSLRENGRVLSGDYLMKQGLNLLAGSHTKSIVVELNAE
ncbi:MAG: alpha-galactosidase [Marinifilaceae bacterium]